MSSFPVIGSSPAELQKALTKAVETHDVSEFNRISEIMYDNAEKSFNSLKSLSWHEKIKLFAKKNMKFLFRK